MRNPRTMSREKLVTVVQLIQHALWGIDIDEQGDDAKYDCDHEWDESTVESVAAILHANDLRPASSSDTMDKLDGGGELLFNISELPERLELLDTLPAAE